MKARVKFEWRQLEEPEGHQDAAWVIKNALQKAGYSVASMPEVQGVWDEVSSFGAFPLDKFAKAPQQIKEKK